MLWQRAKEMYRDSRFSYVLWVDDDCWWPCGTIATLVSALEGGTHAALSGACCWRAPYAPILGFSGIDFPFKPLGYENGKVSQNYAPDEIIPAAGLALHAILHRASLLSELPDAPFTVGFRETEETSFARRLQEAGKTVAVCMAARFGHVESTTGVAFMPNEPPGRIVGNRFFPSDSRPRLEILTRYALQAKAHSYGARVDATAKEMQAITVQRLAKRYRELIR